MVKTAGAFTYPKWRVIQQIFRSVTVRIFNVAGRGTSLNISCLELSDIKDSFGSAVAERLAVHVDDFDTRALGPISSCTERAQCRRRYMPPSRHRGAHPQRLPKRTILVSASSNVRIRSSAVAPQFIKRC